MQSRADPSQYEFLELVKKFRQRAVSLTPEQYGDSLLMVDEFEANLTELAEAGK